MAQKIANPPVTFTPEQLHAVIAQAIAEHEAGKAQKVKADSSTDYDRLTIKAFKKAGFENVKPREDVKTYNLWIAAGRRVRAGEKSIKVRQLRLWHISQTEALSLKEKTAALAQLEERRAKRTSDKLPQVSPVSEPPKPTAKAKPKKTKATVVPLSARQSSLPLA